MASIVVCGAGPIGLCTALLLAREGHELTVLERDKASPPPRPVDAWTEWERTGVAQFHQPHNFLPRFRRILDDELPGLVDRLVETGCVWLDALALMPPSIEDRSPRADDDKFRFVTGRRPVVEATLARAAEENGRVDIRRGVAVTGLRTGPSALPGVPHVTGVQTVDGEALDADLVVDALGRRTRLSEWLTAAGARAPFTDASDGGFTYYTQYFSGPQLPEMLGPPVVEIGSITLLVLPGDNQTWSVTVFAASADTALRTLRDPDRFAAVVRACPLHAHWLNGEAITGVLPMAGILDRYRRLVVDGAPVATGVVTVGDSWACTNPSAGRGISIGLIHAQILRDAVRNGLDDPETFVRVWDETTETRVAPFYWDQIRADRTRIAEMDALRQGREPPPRERTEAAIRTAMRRDADVFRGALEIRMCLALPDEVVARPGFMDKVAPYVTAEPPAPLPGPDRSTLLRLIA